MHRQFSDKMVKDVVTGECYRADKLLEAHIDRLLEDPAVTSERRVRCWLRCFGGRHHLGWHCRQRCLLAS